MTIPRNIRHFALPAILTLMSGTALFAQSGVQSELSAGETEVGQAVELRITASGKSQARLLDNLEVDGLVVQGNQQGVQMQMSFPGGMQVTTSQTLIVVPTRPGDFTIPSLRVEMGGRIFKTAPSRLKVTPSTGAPPPAIATPPGRQHSGRNSLPDEAQPFFGEMLIPKTSAYVGEVIPVDLRFSVEDSLPTQFNDRPHFGGEGFTVRQTARPIQTSQEKNGIGYACLVFRTAITAAKAGSLEIPPASVAARIRVPARAPQGDDFFGGLLQGFGLMDERDVEIKTNGAVMDVKPLPHEGRPETFTGAVGEDFSIKTSASPQAAGPGEPVVLKVVISGRGNFEAMGPPVLSDADGWKVYDPSDSFEPSPSDPIGYNGQKTYEFTLVAKEDRKATPSVHFSFFNPSTGKYATLEGAPVSVDAKGSSTPAQAVTPAQQPVAPTPSPQASPTQSPSSELVRAYRPASFVPEFRRTAYIATTSILGTLWLVGLGFLLARNYGRSDKARRAREAAGRRRTLRELGSPQLSDTDFLAGAAAFLDALGPAGDGTDLDEIRARHELARYSTRKPAPLDLQTRERMIAALHKANDEISKS